MRLSVKDLPPPAHTKPKKEFVLTLNGEEAALLTTLLGRITGSHAGYRGITSNMYYELESKVDQITLDKIRAHLTDKHKNLNFDEFLIGD